MRKFEFKFGLLTNRIRFKLSEQVQKLKKTFCISILYYPSIHPERLIGRGESIIWASQSPDLNPLDFYLWEHLKHIHMYSQPVTIMEELHQRT